MATILIDLDDTVWILLDQWLKRYNEEYNDNVTRYDIKGWDLTPYIKKECGSKIYKYLEDPTLYDDVQLYDGAEWGIGMLRKMGHRCVFLSAGVHAGKLALLKKHNLIETEKDLIIAQDKSLVKGRFLVDDGMHNLKSFGGVGILMRRPHNESFSHPYIAENWKDVVKIIRAVEEWDNRNFKDEDRS